MVERDQHALYPFTIGKGTSPRCARGHSTGDLACLLGERLTQPPTPAAPTMPCLTLPAPPGREHLFPRPPSVISGPGAATRPLYGGCRPPSTCPSARGCREASPPARTYSKGEVPRGTAPDECSAAGLCAGTVYAALHSADDVLISRPGEVTRVAAPGSVALGVLAYKTTYGPKGA